MTYDPLNELTIGELDLCSRMLKADIVKAIHGATEDRWKGMAILGYVMGKRTDPTVKLDAFLAMTPAQLTDALGMGRDDDDRPVEPADDDLDAAELVDDDAGQGVDGALETIRRKATADPTGRTRA